MVDDDDVGVDDVVVVDSVELVVGAVLVVEVDDPGVDVGDEVPGAVLVPGLGSSVPGGASM